MALYDKEVGRRKTVWTDLPPRMKGRLLASGKILYYYRAGSKEIPLGSNRILANEEWARLENGGQHSQLWPRITRVYRETIFPTISLSTRLRYAAGLNNWDAYFKNFTLEQIEPRHIKDYMRRRSKKGAALLEKKIGSAFFNWAREEGHTKAPNPFLGVKFSKAERRSFGHLGKRTVYVTDEQYQQVWQAADPTLQDAMDLALHTGQRPGDLLRARRHDIIEGVLWFVQEKTGTKVGVKVEGGLKSVLERIQARPRAVPSMYFLCDRRGQRISYQTLNKRFLKARGEATWQFRDIRAKTASDMPDLKKAQLLLGHSVETTTTIYRRDRGEAVSPLERKIRDAS